MASLLIWIMVICGH